MVRPGAAVDRAGGRPPRQRAHHGPERHGQGTDRPRDPRLQPPWPTTVHPGRLRSHHRYVVREPHVRAREGLVHRRHVFDAGLLSGRRRRHYISGRNRGDGTGAAGQAAAGAATTDRRAGREPPGGSGRRAGARGDEPGTVAGSGRGAVSRGSLLPAQRRRHSDAAASRAARGRARARIPVPGRTGRPPRHADVQPVASGDRRAPGIRLAGQRPGTGERAGTGGDVLVRRRDRPRRPQRPDGNAAGRRARVGRHAARCRREPRHRVRHAPPGRLSGRTADPAGGSTTGTAGR